VILAPLPPLAQGARLAPVPAPSFLFSYPATVNGRTVVRHLLSDADGNIIIR